LTAPVTSQSLADTATTALADDQPLFRTVKDFAAKLGGVSEWWVRDQFYAGKLKGHRFGGRLMIPSSELARIAAESESSYVPAATTGIGIGAIAPAYNRKRAADRKRREAARKGVVSSTKRASR
jgi:hypothetical protein